MRTIRDLDLENKKVIIRVDFNVPIKDGIILDDTRIKESLETINYALAKNAKVVLMSHLGRVKTNDDKVNTLYPVAIRLSELINKKVVFIDETHGDKLDKAVDNLKNGEVLLMENTRFEDIDGSKESSNDENLSKYWASLGEVFINDAFGTAHREHASNVGISKYLPSGVGFLIEKELKVMDEVMHNPKRPLTVILGGSKVSDKIGVIKNFADKADYILIGGAMAFTFLKASGMEIGTSLLDNDSIDFCKEMLTKYEDKIILPIDVVTNRKNCFISDITPNEKGLDIGMQTVKLFSQYLRMSKTILWNGPVGMYEDEKYSYGTKGLCETLKSIDALKIAGGGDTAAAIKLFGYETVFSHISTGGGASLELLEGKKLKGIENEE